MTTRPLPQIWVRRGTADASEMAIRRSTGAVRFTTTTGLTPAMGQGDTRAGQRPRSRRLR
jgi:hypothetical protein